MTHKLVVLAVIALAISCSVGNTIENAFKDKPDKRTYKLVFLVDDIRSTRMMTEVRVRAAGSNIATRTFSNGNDAIAALDSDRPDLIISDVVMPAGTGGDVLRAAKKRGIPTIMISSEGIDDVEATRKKWIKRGAVDFISRAEQDPRLIDAIRKVLSPAEPDAAD